MFCEINYFKLWTLLIKFNFVKKSYPTVPLKYLKEKMDWKVKFIADPKY